MTGSPIMLGIKEARFLAPYLQYAFPDVVPELSDIVLQIFHQHIVAISSEKKRKEYAKYLAEIYNKSVEITDKFSIEQIYAMVDSALAEYMKTANASCKAGCSHCCYQKVDLFGNEQEFIFKQYDGREPELIKLQASASGKYGFDERLTKKERRCVFLVKGLCSIYKNRPLLCRTHFVVSDPKLCDTDIVNGPIAKVAQMKIEILVSTLFRFGLKPMAKVFHERTRTVFDLLN